VVVTVVAVRVVQVTVDQVVGMVAVRHLLVATAGAVLMAGVVTATIMLGRAARGVGRVHLQLMLLDVAARGVMQVAVVQVIGVVAVAEGRVAAAGAVLVRVSLVMGGHAQVSSLLSRWGRFRFGGVRQRVMNQIGHVPICQCVIQVVAFPPPHDQPFAP
jgi:hypothetical protein